MKKRRRKESEIITISRGLSVIAKGILTSPFVLVKMIRKAIQKRQREENTRKRTIQGAPRENAIKEVHIKEGRVNQFESEIFEKESTIGIILGARGTGKSALGMRLLENAKAKKASKKIYAMGFSKETLPSWISHVQSASEIQNNALVLIDEGGILFSSRKSMTSANKILSELLLIARHKNISILFISQNSSNLEINILRQADFLLLKPSSLLQKDFERKIIKEIYTKNEQEFLSLKKDKGLFYIHSDSCQGFASNTLPSFWNTKISKSWK